MEKECRAAQKRALVDREDVDNCEESTLDYLV